MAAVAAVYAVTFAVSSLSTSARSALGVFVGVVLGCALVAYGVWGLTHFELECVSSDRWICVPSEESQRQSSIVFCLLLIAAGLGVWGLTVSAALAARRRGW